MNSATKSSTKRDLSESTAERLSAEERDAIKERAAELKAANHRGRGSKEADGVSDVLAKIAEMAGPTAC